MTDVWLIDANTIVTIQVFDEMTEEYIMEKITVAKAIDRWSDEGCPPPIDAVPVVHGRWILVSKGNFSPGGFEIEEKCSECGRYVYRYEGQPQDNYCPNCGAKMDAKEE